MLYVPPLPYRAGHSAFNSDETSKQKLCCVSSDPDTPTTPHFSDIGQTSVTLSWQPGESQTITSTNIQYRKSSTGENWMSRRVPPLSGDDEGRSRRNVDRVREFVLEELEPATEYIVRVVVDSFGKTSFSHTASFETSEFSVCFCAADITILQEIFTVCT